MEVMSDLLNHIYFPFKINMMMKHKQNLKNHSNNVYGTFKKKVNYITKLH